MEIYKIKLKTEVRGNWHEMLRFCPQPREIIDQLDIPPFDGDW